MEAARSSETSVDNYFTRQYIPEDKSELHTHKLVQYNVFLLGVKSSVCPSVVTVEDCPL
jgi:hypothetical protein